MKQGTRSTLRTTGIILIRKDCKEKYLNFTGSTRKFKLPLIFWKRTHWSFYYWVSNPKGYVAVETAGCYKHSIRLIWASFEPPTRAGYAVPPVKLCSREPGLIRGWVGGVLRGEEGGIEELQIQSCCEGCFDLTQLVFCSSSRACAEISTPLQCCLLTWGKGSKVPYPQRDSGSSLLTCGILWQPFRSQSTPGARAAQDWAVNLLHSNIRRKDLVHTSLIFKTLLWMARNSISYICVSSHQYNFCF